MWRALAFAVALAVALPASAETRVFDGVRFEAPERLIEYDGPPRPDGAFLRLKNGERTDPHAEFIEVMSMPEAALEGLVTRAGFADFVLTPAGRFCGRHEVLRNATRTVGETVIIDVGYVCYDHSRQPQFSRQVVRSTSVFHDSKMTGFLFVRMWSRAGHPDDQLTAEQWMQPTDVVAASIEVCGAC